MIQLNRELIVSLGLGDLHRAYQNRFLRYIYDVLEIRVGMNLAGQMSGGQLEEFENIFTRSDEAAALEWIAANFPGYKEVVHEEFEKLKNEIRAGAEEILAMDYPDGEGARAPSVEEEASA